MARSTSASGHAEANVTRMRVRVALSMTRAATLRNRRRRALNSALARAAALCIACWTRYSRAGGEAHLIGIGRAALGAITGELGFVQLDQVPSLSARAVELDIDVLG